MSSWSLNSNNWNNNNLNSFRENSSNDLNKIDQINNKINIMDNKLVEIKNELNILKYKESTKHIVHQGIYCNQCKKNNITGIRFKCCTCPNYDICEDCERYLIHFHDNSHFFLRIHDSSLYNSLLQQQQQQQQQQQKNIFYQKSL